MSVHLTKAKKILKQPSHLALFLLEKKWSCVIPDKAYIKMVYRLRMKKKLNLKNPQTLNEKLQWLKLYDRKSVYSIMVDKYEVKKYVAEQIGEEYIIPTLGVWNSFDEIDFDKLPNQFVLKCTHDSGGLVICNEKSKLDTKAAKEKIERCIKKNYFWHGREWPYKDVSHRIIAEQYMTDDGEGLADYKVHCFNGVPKVILVCRDRFKNSGLTEDFFTVSWDHIDVKRPDHTNSSEEIKRPQSLEVMLQLAGKLSEGIPFSRIDFYVIQGKVYFGEITFFPATGMKQFVPEHYDRDFGNWVTLPID